MGRGKQNERIRGVILILFLVVVVFLLVFFSFKTYSKYKNWQEHKSYFDLPEDKQKIEPWMSLRLIENKFGVNLEQEFNDTLFFYEKRLTLEEYCRMKSLDCDKVLAELNKND